jgi:hypothetical protein
MYFMSSINNSISYNNTIYPYCYKIKDGCLPCPINHLNKCLLILSRLICAKNLKNVDLEKKFDDELFYCLKEYGDIYKKLNIELFVNPKTKLINFPDIQRIQSNLNLYLQDIYKNDANKNLSEEEENKVKDKFILYSVLLTEKIKEKYDEYYYSKGFSDVDSLQPKEYGIVRLLGNENENETSGGKKNNKTKRRKNNKTKRRKNNKTKNKPCKI